MLLKIRLTGDKGEMRHLRESNDLTNSFTVSGGEKTKSLFSSSEEDEPLKWNRSIHSHLLWMRLDTNQLISIIHDRGGGQSVCASGSPTH